MPNLQASPADPSLSETRVLDVLVKFPLEYDWDALAVLTPTYDKLLRLYRMVLRGLNPNLTSITEEHILRDRSFRTDMRLISDMAGSLKVTAGQRSKFARLAGIALSWQTNSQGHFRQDDAMEDDEIIDKARPIWRRILDQKMTLAWLREATDNTVGMKYDRFNRVVYAHSLDMSPWDASAYSHPLCAELFTSAQVRSMAHHKLSPGFVRHVFETGRAAETHPTIQEVVELRDADVPWDYLTTLLRSGETAHAIVRLWKNSIPLEYALA